MIEFRKMPVTSDGVSHISIEAAQKHELAKVLNIDAADPENAQSLSVIDALIQQRESVLAILNLKTRKPRAKNGTGKAKKAKATTDAKVNAALQDNKQ